jgi:glucan phosphoethanolaminetransferase (alkaline phosphatase superfamily)
MKELFKKVFSQKTSSSVFVGFGAFAIFTFIVFPGLTAADTMLNVLSGIVGIFSLIFLYYYIKMDKFINNIMNFEPGETELDYINPNELKPKRKRTVKAKPPVNKIVPTNKTNKQK